MTFRNQPYAFDSPAAAIAAMIAHIRAHGTPRPSEFVDLEDAAGRILTAPLYADRDSPAFDHAAMDGYAVSAAAIRDAAAGGEIKLPVVAESRIGCPPPPLNNPDHAIRIATGAPIPAGADAVIRREDVVEETSREEPSADRSNPVPAEVRSIRVSTERAERIKTGENIRRRAENAHAGSLLLNSGQVLSAAAIGTLASAGDARPRVFRRLHVAIITTGEELVRPDQAPGSYQVRDSNGLSIRAILSSQRWIDAGMVAHARDEAEVNGLLNATVQIADAVVLTGGVSVGHRDPVRATIRALGGRIAFHGLPQRPGKPMLGAWLDMGGKRVAIFGLPGNPVSAMVTCTRIVLPVLARCAGIERNPPALLPRTIRLTNYDGRTLDLWWHRLARLTPGPSDLPQAELIDAQGSGDIVAAGASDGFVEIPPGQAHETMPFYAWPGTS